MYEKQNFTDGQVLEAEHLNKMEDELARPKSWNELADKPFGDELVELMPETEGVPQELDGLPAIEASELLTIGTPDALFVTFDGVEYICNAIVIEGMIVYGNVGILGMPDTGEPFLVVPLMGAVAVMDMQPHTLGISMVAEKKLDPKYFPRTVLYCGNDDYLYTDIACTTKATIEDVPDTTQFDIGLVENGVVLYVCAPTFIESKILGLLQEYRRIYFSLISGTGVAYTAEYTPPTT